MDTSDLKAKDGAILVRVQKRLLRLKAKYRTWRRVGAVLGCNHFYFNFVMQGNVPTNEKIRRALGFPKRMPSERKPRVKRADWREGQDKYLERVK